MKFGDQVVFIENGKEFSATVLSARILDHHLGENDEPLLALGFFVEVPGVLGTARALELVQFRTDVAHESHEFGAAAAQAKLAGIYPGGRWREVNVLAGGVGALGALAGGIPIPPAAIEVPKVEAPAAEEEQKPPVSDGGSEEPPPTVN